MRRTILILALVLVIQRPASAQNAQTPPVTAPSQADRVLDGYLQRWEQEMAHVQTLAAEIRFTEYDPTFKSTRKTAGYAKYMKVGNGANTVNLASLELYNTDPRGAVGKMTMETLSEKILLTTAFMYVYIPDKKEIQAHPVRKPQGSQIADDNIFTMMFGMRADDARRRYDMKLANEDQYYLYIMVIPKNAQDRADFGRARIVLNKQTFLPAQLWFEKDAEGKKEVTWEIPQIRTGVKLERQDFDAPRKPDGWKIVTMPADEKGTARTFRP